MIPAGIVFLALYTRLLTVERRQDALSGDSDRVKSIIVKQEDLNGIIARQEQQIISVKESIGNLNNKINSRQRTENKRERELEVGTADADSEIAFPSPPVPTTPFQQQQPQPRLILRRKDA